MRQTAPRLVVLAAAAVLCLAAVVWAITQWRQQHTFKAVYRIGYNHNPPMNWRAPDGKPSGFAVDAVTVAARNAGLRLEWIYDESPSAAKLRNGEVDLWPLFSDIPERRDFAYVSDPYMISDNYLLVRGTGGLPAKDFAGDIHFSGPSLYQKWIRQTWPAAKQVSHTDPKVLVPVLCEGGIDRAFVSSHQANLLLRDLQRDCPEIAFRAYHLTGLSVRLGVGARHDSANAADRIRAEILHMAQSGQLGGILTRYSHVGLSETRTILTLVESERLSRTLAWALAGLAVMSLVMAWLIWRTMRARKAAIQASAAKGEFLANMSHEIRTPLGGVIGMVELALESPLPPVARDYLSTAHSSANTLLAILNDILDLSKIEARRLEIAPVDVDIRDIVSAVAGLMGPVAKSKGLEFETAFDPSTPAFVRADPVRIKQVLLNLCGNAIKFTAKGSVRIAMNCSQAPGGGPMLQFSVADTGIGIPPEKRQQIFEAFEQADSSVTRLYGGTGLGLAISRQLVELMGGRIWVDSVEGQGSTFSFTVLADQASPDAGAIRAAEHRNAPGGSLRILLAEDNPVNQKLISAMLRTDGHAVTVRANGKAAVEAVQSGEEFDVILMDIQMPEMDGFEATAALRAMDGHRLRDVPIIALTAHAEPSFRQTCLDAGMTSYLSKPIDRAELRRQLAALGKPLASRDPSARIVVC